MPNLGIDLGGTFARAAVVDEGGRILGQAKVALTDRSPGPVIESIAQAAEQAMQKAGARGVRHCGVGFAGQLKGDSGVVGVAPNLGWRDVPFGAWLAQRLGHSVRVINDLRVAAWGEYRAGAGRGAEDILMVSVGSGVGSAAISHGALVLGTGGVAGEFGHIKVLPGGRRCGCGELGCLEAYCSGHNLIAQMREAIESGLYPSTLAQRVGGDLTQLNPVVLETAAAEGDPLAVDLYQRAAALLALAVANYVTVLNPARLILGGGVLLNCPGLRRRVAQGVEVHTARLSFRSLSIHDALLGDDSGIIGAALLASPAEANAVLEPAPKEVEPQA
ncbi:MAG TPA: ROK family protein [Myxococcaceae bacterium]|nr:ROK family protein [Myxococcaceae bacterium]